MDRSAFWTEMHCITFPEPTTVVHTEWYCLFDSFWDCHTNSVTSLRKERRLRNDEEEEENINFNSLCHQVYRGFVLELIFLEITDTIVSCLCLFLRCCTTRWTSEPSKSQVPTNDKAYRATSTLNIYIQIIIGLSFRNIWKRKWLGILYDENSTLDVLHLGP